MKRYFVLGAAAAIGVAPAVMASPVPSIQLGGGQVLNVQSVCGTGSNTSFEVIDFGGTGGSSFAWQYNWDPSTTPSSWDMLSAIQAADPNLTITDTYYGPAWGYFVNGLSYGSNPNNSAGSAYDTSWVFWNGTYTAPGISWVNAESGISSNLLSNDSIDGFYYDPTVNNPPYVSTLAPDAPTTEVPEPAALSLIAAGSVCMLRRRKRRGA